jgi:hypothetical protein
MVASLFSLRSVAAQATPDGKLAALAHVAAVGGEVVRHSLAASAMALPATATANDFHNRQMVGENGICLHAAPPYFLLFQIMRARWMAFACSSPRTIVAGPSASQALHETHTINSCLP